jgi:hypothetical protein
MFGVHFVNPFNGFPRFRRRVQVIDDVNPPDYQNIVFGFNLAGYFRRQMLVARVDFTRFQRASECADQSAARRRDHIIERRRVRFGDIGTDAVMLGDRAVNAEFDRLCFRRKIS